MSAEPYHDDDIVPHDEFVQQMERDRKSRYAKGIAALIGVAVMIIFLGYAITQLAGGIAVFTN